MLEVQLLRTEMLVGKVVMTNVTHILSHTGMYQFKVNTQLNFSYHYLH